MTAVLLYHDVVDASARERTGFEGPLAARYKLDPALFAAHLDLLAATGLRVGVLDEDPPPEVTLTFDDAGVSALAIADMLEGRGWRGYFFAPTAWLGRPGFLDRSRLSALAERGHRVGSHSHTHPTYMATLSSCELDEEWRRSRDLLGDVLGIPPDAASVPGGLVSSSVAASAASCGYRLLFTSEPTTKVDVVDGMSMLGRYAVWSDTPARQAAAYARGDLGPRARLWVEWQAKKTAKRLSPQAYQALRRLRARL